MPIRSCRSDGKPGYKFGDSGHCYVYPPGDDRARREAKRKAIIQGIAEGERPASKASRAAARIELARASLEQRYLGDLTAAYERAIRSVAKAASETFGLMAAASWQPPAEGATLTAIRLAAIAEALNRQTTPIWRRLMIDLANAPLAEIGIAWDVKHPLVAGQLEQAAQRTGRRLGEAVQPVIRKTIADAYTQGLSAPDTAAAIHTAVVDAAPWQAEMLARTDLNSLANGASKSAAKLTGMRYKTWLATMDEKTRPEHADADGQTVPIDGTFIVGGEDADFPGDPNLSDAMAANCRCSLIYGETLDEAEALLAASSVNMKSMHQHQFPERLAEKIKFGDAEECWEWMASRRGDGYGRVWDSLLRTVDLAHRVVYRTLYGEIPEGLTIDHLCRNRGCVNPDHFELVSRGENVMRGTGFAPRNAAKTHCDNGHEFTLANTYIRPDGYRDCRECKRLRQRAYVERKAMASMRERAKRQQRRAAHKSSRRALVAAAIPVHHTGVVAGTWDGNAAMGRCSTAADYRSICAWVESGGNPSQRQSYKFPHHANPGGPANIAGVRNGLARLPQADIPAGDNPGVAAHLRAHLNDYNRRQGANAIEGLAEMSDAEALAAMDDAWGPVALAIRKPSRSLLAAAQPVAFTGTAAIEGIISDDNSLTPRVLLPKSLSWPEMPVPFMAQTVTAEGHQGAEVAGRIDEFTRKRGKAKMQNIDFSGELTTPFGISEIAPMIDDKTMRYVSVDLGQSEWALVNRQTLAEVPEEELSVEDLRGGSYALGLTSGKIKAVTLVPTQALEGATIALTASAEDGSEATVIFAVDFETYEDALVASAAPLKPPREWFETPEPPGKMPLTITEDGRVFGHLATWDSCHVGFLPNCVPPPKSDSNYAYFHVCELDTDAGEPVTVGKLMFSPTDGGHADRSLSAAKASAYYDRTGMAAAYLHVSDGEHGIWAAGSLNPDLNDQQQQEMRRQLRLHPPSGDWRPINGEYELICALAVAVPGFPTPRATVTVTASADGLALEEAIIASSGIIEPDQAALVELEQAGLIENEARTEREMRALAARARGGLEALVGLIKGD